MNTQRRRREPSHVILRRIEKKLDALKVEVGRNEQADKARDEKMASAIQTKINELKSELGPMTDAVEALGKAWDAFLADMAEAKDDPEELQSVIDAYTAQKAKIIEMTLKGTTAAPEQPAA